METEDIFDTRQTFATAAPHAPAPLTLTPVSQMVPTVQQKVRTRDDMLMAAMDRGFSAEQIAQFMDLRDRQAAVDAKNAFNEAFAAFKKNPPLIRKNKHVGFKAKGGGDGANYDHATHDEVTLKIAEALAPHGLSHSWSSEQRDGRIYVTCTLSHTAGHERSTTMDAAYDVSGKKNNIQSIGSAKTYLERYTLLGLTGLTTQGEDDDGAGSEGDEEPSTIDLVFDNLVAQLEQTTNDADAHKLWVIGAKVLTATKCKPACDDFKDLVVKHRNFLASRK